MSKVHSTVYVFMLYSVLPIWSKKLEPSAMYSLFCLGMFAQLGAMFAHRMTG